MQISYNKSYLKKIVKLVPFIILAYIIYDLSKNENLTFSYDFLLEQNWTVNRVLIIVPVLLLMLLNWMVEAKKWQLLTLKYFPLSIKKAFISVLSGVSTALFTPNRVGDFIGRVSYLPKEHRKNGMVSSFFGSYSQWLLTIVMGWIAWIQLGRQFVNSSSVFLSISVLYFVLIVFLFTLFLGRGFKFKMAKRWTKHFNHPPTFTVRVKLISLSLFRYFIFTLQFYLLLRLFGVDLAYGLVLSKLGLFYLLTSLIPSTFWGELGIKESLAVWVFSGLIINSLVIISATLLLWMINLLIPAVLGNYFLFRKASAIS